MLLLSTVLLCDRVGAISHGTVLAPRNAGDKRRDSVRGDLELPEGRSVLEKTQQQRDKFLSIFDAWLSSGGFSLDEILFVKELDKETLNLQLEKYGRCLFKGGCLYNHYYETINTVTGRRSRVRRSLQPAWDLALI